MTAVVIPSSSRNGWSTGPQTSMNNMDADNEGARIFLPRKSAQRSNSASSVASSTSSSSSNSSVSSTSSSTSTSTIPAATSNDTGYNTVNAPRKKPARGIWGTSSKAEPVSAISNARPQPVASSSASAQSAASTMSTLHNPASQSAPPPPSIQQGSQASRGPHPSEPTMLQLQPLNGTFERKTIMVPMTPDILRIGRQTNQKTLPTPSNGYFDSKVLSRQHAEIWSDREGKVWIRDVKSSNGTFVNGKRLSQENRDSEPHPLNFSDILELGIDIVSEDQKTIVHHKVAARVDHAGPHAPLHGSSEAELDFLPGGRMLVAKGPYNPQSQNGGGFNNGHGNGNGNGNGRYAAGGAVASGSAASSYHPKWLQPVSMEQIVKRLNAELRQARRQSSHLTHNASVISTRAVEQRPPLPPSTTDRAPLLPTKSVENIKARFSTIPPAPPPSQPLPDAPPDAVARAAANDLSSFSSLPPVLRRSDTERPKQIITSISANNSPIKAESTSQILSLVEQLSTAQKELAAQAQRLQEVEAALNAERESRHHAEERATRLEQAVAVSSGGVGDLKKDIVLDDTKSDDSGERIDDTVSKKLDLELQRRIDLMKTEMDEMKVRMEEYRQRTSTAEEESVRDRQTLADMVESIRKREEAATRRKEQYKARSRKRVAFENDGDAGSQEVDDVLIEADEEVRALEAKLDGEIRHAELLLHEATTRHINGSADVNGSANTQQMSVSELQELGKAAIAAAMGGDRKRALGSEASRDSKTRPGGILASTDRSRRGEQLAQSVPYASLIGVVLLGVGMMAYLNGWQKVSER